MTSNWPETPLKSMATIIGRGITPKYADNGDFLVINQRCVRDGRISLEYARHHDSSKRTVKNDKIIHLNDILINSTGVGTLGRTAPVQSLPGKLTADSHLTIVRPLQSVHPKWLAYAISFAEPTIEAMAEGSTGQTELSRQRLALLELPLPPLDVQRAIATTLGSLDDKIESNRRLLNLMDELVRAQFQLMFDLSPTSLGVPVSELIAVNPRRTLHHLESAIYVGMSALPESGAEVDNWEMRPAGSGQRFKNGDVLMARITPCLENGKTAVVDMLKSDQIGWGSTEYVVLSPKDEYSTAWIYCLARDEGVRDFAIRSMTGTSGRQRFAASRFDQLKITKPEPDRLHEFNDFANPIFSKMTQLRNENQKLSSLRNVLLPELLSGRIRVPIQRDEVAV